MTNRIMRERDALMETLTNILGDLVTSVSVDAQDVRPLPGKAAILIEPPTVEWPDWNRTVCTWQLDVVAGTFTTQADALPIITNVIDALADAGLNLQRAEPVGFALAGQGTVAAFQITLNPLELTEGENDG